MLCPNCQRENQPTDRFCIFCGSPLPAPQAEGAQQQPQAFQEELHRLREQVNRMNERLTALESRPEITAPIPQTISPPVALKREAAPVRVVKAPPRKGITPKVREREWEQILGGNWLARIGVIALIIGIGFFLKFAIDNNWIGPTGQIILGIVAGLAMLGGSYFWRKRYPILAQAISGGGIAVLYLSIFAAFAIYNLVHFYVTVVLLLLVSVASAVLALRYNSMALAIIGIFGAFVAPFILGAFGGVGPEGGQVGRGIQLLAYVILVDIGVLGLSTFRNWRWFTLLALLCSLASFGVWYNEFGGEVSLAASEVCLTLIFLIFVGATTLFHIIRRRTPEAFDYALMLINAAAYLGISLGLMWDVFRAWMGGFVFLLVLFYSGLSYTTFKRKNVRLSLFALGIALVFFTVSIPTQFGDKAWTTIAWAAEGAVLIWLVSTLRLPQFRSFSYAVFTIMAVRLLFFDTKVDLPTFQPILNERFLAFLVSIAALYFAGWRERKALRKSEVTWTYYPAFLLAANFLSLWVLSFEVWNYFDSRLALLVPMDSTAREALQNTQNLSLTALWAFYAVTALVVGIVKRFYYVRICALALLLIVIGKVFVYDVFKLELAYRIVAFVGLGLLLLISAYLYQRYSKIIRGIFKKK